MATRTAGQVEIRRDHPDAETANGMIEIFPLGAARKTSNNIAMLFCATPSSEQEANAEFIVRAWNSHDQLVAALKQAQARLVFANKHIDCQDDIDAAGAALAAAGIK